MPARNGVTLAAKVVSEFLLHGDGYIKGHGIEHFVQFGQQAQPVSFDDGGGFQAGFVVGESFVGSEAGHANIKAWLGRVALRIGAAELR